MNTSITEAFMTEGVGACLVLPSALRGRAAIQSKRLSEYRCYALMKLSAPSMI